MKLLALNTCPFSFLHVTCLASRLAHNSLTCVHIWICRARTASLISALNKCSLMNSSVMTMELRWMSSDAPEIPTAMSCMRAEPSMYSMARPVEIMTAGCRAHGVAGVITVTMWTVV